MISANGEKIFKANYVFVISDFLFVFILSFILFVSHYGETVWNANLLSSLIFCLSQSASIVLSLFIFRIYKMLTKDVGLFEILKLVIIAVIVLILGLLVCLFVPQLPSDGPFALKWLLYFFSVITILISSRVCVKVIVLLVSLINKDKKIRTLVIGAGVCGKIVVDESIRNPSNSNQVVVFVDDDRKKIGRSFCNIPIEGPITNITSIIDSYNIEEVIVAISEISRSRLREIIDLLNPCPVRIKRLPIISEMQGPNDIRIVDVDLNDLLCREPVQLDNCSVNEMINNTVTLVTGAGGSIGSELVRQIFKTHPKTLILFDIYENSTYDIQMELVRKMREENIKDVELITLIGSTYNEFRVEEIIKKYRPDYIYHAAAYKHVPLMEDSPAEAIRTNVIGTYNVARLADKYKVKKMVLVSTDKAVRPTNVMGATKRFAEMVIQYYASVSKQTKYAAVRFGNVLGSNGSVVPLFKKQIEAGGPITITDKRITRYFMTIPEAVSLILQCGLYADGGEIFILDMGKPVRILDLAERLIRQAGKVPEKDIEIVEIGLRPGEKLYEELLLDKENQIKTDNRRIFIEQNENANKNILSDLEEVSKAFNMENKNDVKELLSNLIKTYRITENEKK